MRKIRGFTALLFICAAAVALFFALAVLPDRLAFDGGDKYTFYVGDTSKNCRVVTCPAGDAAITRLTLQKVCGESATFPSLDMQSFLESVNGEIIFTETLDDSVNYYCTAALPYAVELYGKQINLHICVKSDSVTVGSPIIFGGY